MFSRSGFWHSRSPQPSNALQRDSDALYLREVCSYRLQATGSAAPCKIPAGAGTPMRLPSCILSGSKNIPRRRLERAGAMWIVANNNRAALQRESSAAVRGLAVLAGGAMGIPTFSVLELRVTANNTSVFRR